MSVTAYEHSQGDIEMPKSVLLHNMKDVMENLPKFYYRIVEICGDYYYQSLPKEKALEMAIIDIEEADSVLNTQDDISNFV